MAKMRHQSQRHDLDRLIEEAGLPPAFHPTRITHADLDIEVERGGAFLDGECKWNDEPPLSTGQALTMSARAADGRDVFVLYFERGPQRDCVEVPIYEETLTAIQRWTPDGPGPIRPATINEYWQLTQRWLQKQERRKREAA